MRNVPAIESIDLLSFKFFCITIYYFVQIYVNETFSTAKFLTSINDINTDQMQQ